MRDFVDPGAQVVLSLGPVNKIPGHGARNQNIFPISLMIVIWPWLREEEEMALLFLASLKSIGNAVIHSICILTQVTVSSVGEDTTLSGS